MSDNRNQRNLPIRTLHDFLVEINNEWSKFRTGSFLSIVVTIILFVIFIPRYLLFTIRARGIVDDLIALAIIAAIFYNIYLSYRQHQFYQKWEKRLGLLLHIEDQLLTSS